MSLDVIHATRLSYNTSLSNNERLTSFGMEKLMDGVEEMVGAVENENGKKRKERKERKERTKNVNFATDMLAQIEGDLLLLESHRKHGGVSRRPIELGPQPYDSSEMRLR